MVKQAPSMFEIIKKKNDKWYELTSESYKLAKQMDLGILGIWIA